MGQALYRKYRPTSFDQAVGQEHITQTLGRAIKSGKISHAYLFTGPRGIGKTSVARILAHEVNNLPYKDDSIHLDIIEIDAASNRRIDEIRELRDKVHIAPTSAKYKVYIIDEVHMLTREAFNALLKTLEEPPAHCIFILATTEVHKLPETIISRTQRFSFNPVNIKTAAKHLESIAKSEKITISDKALELLAQHGQGSFRDSISMLDQLSNSKGGITEDSVRDMLGLPPESSILELLNDLKSGDAAKLLNDLEQLNIQGTNSAAIAKALSRQLRNQLIHGEYEPWVIELLRDLLEISASANPEESLEITLLNAIAKNPGKAFHAKKVEPASKQPSDNTKKDEITEKNEPRKVSQSSISKQEIVADLNTDFNMEYWPEIVEYAKKHAASLYTGLKLARPSFSDNTLTLYFKFSLHQKKLSQTIQKDTIGKIIEKVSGTKVKVECEVNKDMFSADLTSTPAAANDDSRPLNSSAPLKSISNIFGNAEMLS